ncbi:helix-turn-helix domain-containing protein [Aquibium sp. LZ166]|uniref:Helix-turn-helix domain-containing protein n=1 Tax=Aquibium pacificus TaxID=3153579 RepID=A0ABV3SMG9_9HYPH
MDDIRTRQNSTVPAGYAPLMLRRPVRPELAADVFSIVGYRENGDRLQGSLEMAPLVVPLIVSFGEPFEIALGRAPTPRDRFGSFTSGLYPGFVMINSTGGAECIQVDFTPPGAFRFFGLPMSEIANRMVGIDDLADPEIRELRQRLGEEHDWQRRFALVEAFLIARLDGGQAASPEVAWAYDRILRRRGGERVADIATALGWSRKHLAERFRTEIGIGAKAVSRMARFNRALELARQETPRDWAGIAADCGYSDQAHLVREFRMFSGSSPTALAPHLA